MTTPLRTKISLVLAGAFVFLVLLEVSLRLGGFIISSLQEYRNLQSIKHKGTYRIMCLGESTTRGQYPVFLEEALNQRSNIGIKFSVIDKGVVGANSSIILAQLESNLAQYHPDMIVAMMGSNDHDILYYKDIPESHTKLFYYCDAYRFIRILWSRFLNKTGESGTGTYTKLAWRYQTQGKFSQAEDAFKKEIELNPQSDGAYIGLGRLYRKEAKLSQAQDIYKRAIALKPQNAGVYYIELGKLYRAQGKFSQAEEAFNQAIALTPKTEHAYIGLGQLYQAQGKFSRAEGAFTQAIALNPQSDGAYIGLGWVYHGQGKFLQSEGAFTQAIALNPQSDGAYIGLGETYQAQGKLSQAEDAFKKAVELDTENDRIYGALSVLYGQMGKPELAEKYARRADGLRSGYYMPLLANNYRKLKAISDKRKIRLVCMQYPMRSLEPLRNIFEGGGRGVIFVDNEKAFKDAVEKEGYVAYFQDAFGGDFGHCTDKGNRLLAENIANVILAEVFHQ